jgi:hypothetical protein
MNDNVFVGFAVGFIIEGEDIDDETNEHLYWNNEDGWTKKENATIFTKSEINSLNMPIGWINIEKIKK